MSSAKYRCGTVSSYTNPSATMSSSSKAKKFMTKTNRSQAGIKNMVSNISSIVGYSNVVPFLEHDTGNMTSGTNKDICSRKHCNIPSDANVAVIFHDDCDDDDDNDNDGDGDGGEGDVDGDDNGCNDNCILGNEEADKSNRNNKNNDETNNAKNTKKTKNNNVYDETDAYVDVETDSLASMETLSDNVAIWVDGERHWISGVDANTTCTDLICALLNYQTGQQMFNDNTENIYTYEYNGRTGDNRNLNANSNDVDRRGTKSNTCNNEISNNNCNIGGGNNAINQSMPTKEGKQEIVRAAVYQDVNCHSNQNCTSRNSNCSNSNNNSNNNSNKQTTKASTFASEYVIVKQHRHCEEYLDGNVKVFDVLPTKAEGVLMSSTGRGPNRKECELFLRRLVSSSSSSSRSRNRDSTAVSIEGRVGTSPSTQHAAGNTQVASLLSTDKDSGMGSPVGSSRSARFRRRKYKSSSSWFAQGNTLHPKVALQRAGNGGFFPTSAGNNIDNVANERLMRIILAQDETIHRQLSLLREKEKQISKIEEEKHRVRERELGKNYLLETYLKGLDEAICEPNNDADEEIFIDEPYQPRVENIETTAMKENSQQQNRNARHNKKFSYFQHQLKRCQQRSNQLGKNTSRDAAKAKNFIACSKVDGVGIGVGVGEGDADADGDANVMAAVNVGSGFDSGCGTATGSGSGVGGNADADAVDDGNRDGDGDAGDDDDADADTDAVGVGDVDNRKEIELQIFWLEKVYALNKQLQREEETLLKLHAKIRKHQVRCAYQMKNDVLEQIDELDAKLALQCADICRVEDNLEISNEQLKGKLHFLEKLNSELQDIQELNTLTTNSTSTSKPTTSISTSKSPPPPPPPPLSTSRTSKAVNFNIEKANKISELQSKSIMMSDVYVDGVVVSVSVSDADDNVNVNGDVNAVDGGVDDDDVEIIDLEMKTRKRKPIIEMNNFLRPTINVEEEIMFTSNHQSSLNKQIPFDELQCIELQNMNNKLQLNINDAGVEVNTSSNSPMTNFALSTSLTHSSMLNKQDRKQNLNEIFQQQNECLQQQQQQQQLKHQHQQQKPQQRVHNYPISRFNQFEQSSAIAVDMKTNVIATTTASMTMTTTTTTKAHSVADKNMLSQQHAPNVKIVKKPMYEALSLNQMPSATSVAVTCQQKVPSSIPTPFISSPKLTLNDENGIDLSHLGTLV